MKKSFNQQQLCSSYELFYRLLFDCDPTLEREERAQRLLQVLLQLDAMGSSIPRHDFSDMVSKAIVACGFDDEDEAWEALMRLVEPAVLWDQDTFPHNAMPADRHGPN
jgi:hypothetical protein